MDATASQITSLAIVYSTVYSRRRSKKTSKLRVTEGNSSVTAEFHAQRASNAENGSISWRHHVSLIYRVPIVTCPIRFCCCFFGFCFCFLEKVVRGQKHHMEADNCRNNMPNIDHFIVNRYSQHPVQDNQCPKSLATKGRTSPPSVRHLHTNQMLHHLDIYIWLICKHTIRVSIWTKPRVIRRKRIVITGFGVCSSACYQWADKFTGTIGVDQLPPSTVWSKAQCYLFVQ